MPNPETPGNKNHEPSMATEVKKLPAELGFNLDDYDPTLIRFRESAVNAMIARNWDEIPETINYYQKEAEEVISHKLDAEYIKAQIALIIDTALMWLEAGKIDSYAADIWNARLYATNMGYKEVTDILDPAWEEVESIQIASEQWSAKKSTDNMVAEAMELFKDDPAILEEINARANLSADSFLADIVNVLFVYGHDDPLKLVTELGWVNY